MYTVRPELVEGHPLKINVLRQAQDERIILYFGLAINPAANSIFLILFAVALENLAQMRESAGFSKARADVIVGGSTLFTRM